LSVFTPGAVHAQPAAADAAESPLAAEPTTPEELFRAVLLTLKLDRPVVARRYLDSFLAASPDDDLLLKLRDEYGTATFMQLARREELQPASEDLMGRIRTAALSRISDPASLMFSSTSSAVRRAIDSPLCGSFNTCATGPCRTFCGGSLRLRIRFQRRSRRPPWWRSATMLSVP